MPFIIDDTTPVDVHSPGNFSKGYVRRPFGTFPVGCYDGVKAFDMPLVPRSEWVDRIKEGHANKRFVSYTRRKAGPNGGPIPSLDQNGIGYCWNHSATMCQMLVRALANMPYVRLSAFMVGCLVKNYRDEGGWGAAAVDFIQKNGVPSVDFWPEKKMDRKLDTPAMRENAKLHIITEGWMDMAAAEYDRNLTEDQVMTALLLNNPVVGDFNWWSHSVCLMDPVLMSEAHAATDFGSLDLNDPTDHAVFAAAFGKKGLNSWTDQWGDLGEFTLTDSKAKLDGGVAVSVASASVV